MEISRVKYKPIEDALESQVVSIKLPPGVPSQIDEVDEEEEQTNSKPTPTKKVGEEMQPNSKPSPKKALNTENIYSEDFGGSPRTAKTTPVPPKDETRILEFA